MFETHLFESDGSLRSLVQLINRLLVVTEINLASNQNDRKALAEVKNLGDPLKDYIKVSGCPYPLYQTRVKITNLLLNVVQRVGGVDGKANQDDM